MGDPGQTHYCGDSCDGGHADVADLLGLCAGCGRVVPCRHCNQEEKR